MIGGAVTLLGGLLVGLKFKLSAWQALDLAPSRHWPAIAPELIPDQDRGPVLVTVEYDVADGQSAQFVRAMEQIREERYRDGAVTWGLYEEVETPHRFIETFVVESWLEHLRQHERVTFADQELQQAAASLLRSGTSVRVKHYVYAKKSKAERRDHEGTALIVRPTVTNLG
jgi:hypothetical protein